MYSTSNGQTFANLLIKNQRIANLLIKEIKDMFMPDCHQFLQILLLAQLRGCNQLSWTTSVRGDNKWHPPTLALSSLEAVSFLASALISIVWTLLSLFSTMGAVATAGATLLSQAGDEDRSLWPEARVSSSNRVVMSYLLCNFARKRLNIVTKHSALWSQTKKFYKHTFDA